MSFIALYETERDVVMTSLSYKEKKLKQSLYLHLATVYDANSNEDMVFYHIYARNDKDAKQCVRNHFSQTFPQSSDAYCWKVDSVKIN